MPAAIFNGDAVKVLKDKIRFKDGTEITATQAAANVISNSGSSTDNTIARFDGTNGLEIQTTNVVIDDSDAVSGITSLTVDNVNIDTNIISTSSGNLILTPQGSNSVEVTTRLDVDNITINSNTISSTDANGNIILTPNGTGKVVISSDLQVDGTTTTVNSSTLDVTDSNITVNNGGNQASADTNDAGLTVEMSDATDAIIHYDSTLASKWALGEVGSTSEVIDAGSTQTITGLKTVSRTGASSGFEIDHNGAGNALEITQAGAGDALDIGAGNLTISNAGNVATSGSLTLSSLTASRVLTTDGSSIVAVSSVTATELGYVSGVTSAIQTQIDTKIEIDKIFNMTTGSGVFSATANATTIVDTSGGAATITLPAPASTEFVRIKDNGNAEANNITINQNSSETIDGSASHVINSDYGNVVLASDGTNWWIL